MMPLALTLLLLLTLHPGPSTAGRAQRRQRLAEETLRPYVERVDPGELCKLLRCRTPVGSWCQVVQEDGIRVPKCVCPQSCPRQGAPACSVLGKTYGNQCLLHKEACRKRRHIGLAHLGPCIVTQSVCTEEEYEQFPYRLLDWFLLVSTMGESNGTSVVTQSCLSHTHRQKLAEVLVETETKWRFGLLDRNHDGKLSRRDLKKLRYKQMPLEHCASRFFLSCDNDGNRKVTLQEWTGCLVDRSEAWFQEFMSMKMGSRKLCRVEDNNH